jgi:type VI secretion system protein ImpB
MAESTQQKLNRVRKPRVHIQYEIETEGATVKKDLPFVVGVMGDFSGDPTEKLKPFRDRDFTSIDRDNFDDVLKRMAPGLNIRVENTLKGDGSEMGIQLKFDSMDDFDPARVANQVEPLRKLLETREQLKEILTKVDLSPGLEETLEKVLANTENIGQMASDLGVEATDDNSSDDGEG